MPKRPNVKKASATKSRQLALKKQAVVNLSPNPKTAKKIGGGVRLLIER